MIRGSVGGSATCRCRRAAGPAIIVRAGGLVAPRSDEVLRAGDEILFFAAGAQLNQAAVLVQEALRPLA